MRVSRDSDDRYRTIIAHKAADKPAFVVIVLGKSTPDSSPSRQSEEGELTWSGARATFPPLQEGRRFSCPRRLLSSIAMVLLGEPKETFLK